MISVIVPVYNVEKYIVKCLDSIVNQEYRDFELILVDDGSEDNSIGLAREFLIDSKIEWRVIVKENGGLASARNAGLKEAKGDLVSFIDSDDVVSSDFLKELNSALCEGEYDFSFCGFSFIKDMTIQKDENEKRQIYDREELLWSFLKRNIAFVVPSMLFRKHFLIDNDLFFEEEIRFSEDQPFIWNTILHSSKAIYLYKKMYGYFIRENSIMTSTSYEKIMNSYAEYKKYTSELFSRYPEYNHITDKALPRWELGSLFTASKLVDYNNYRYIYEQMDGKTILSRIKGIGESKAYLLATVAIISPWLLYRLCNKLNLNG